MSNMSDWLKYELYPSLYESIDTALPEFSFNRFSGGWRSGLKIDLSNPKERRVDKTVVSRKAPGVILEQGGDILSLVSYVMMRDRVVFIEAVKTLADVVGLQLPKDENFNQESYQRYKDQSTILEDCNSYFIYCLENSKGADEIRAYLSSRGYSEEDIKAMELGYIPDQDKLFKYLLSKGYSQSLIDEVVKLNKGIGSTHRLTIPYRSGGSLKGFKFRTIRDATPKYLNSTGLDKIGGFFNLLGLKGDKDVVIVEGELDSLSATAKGVENVVATGGSSINKDQVKDAIKRGAKSFTLCLDTEPGKEETTAKNITSAIDILLNEGVNRVYIVTLPDLGGGKTDPDRLIKEKGVEAFKHAIKEAISYYRYKLQAILKKHISIQDAGGGELTDKEIDSLLEEIIETSLKIPNATDRERYKKDFISLSFIKELGISEESLSITLDKLTSTKDKEDQAKELNELLKKANKLQDNGEIDQALELLDNKVKEVKLKDKATEFSGLLIPIKESELRERQSNKPNSLKSGYTIGGEDLLLPAGAITILSAPTSHGKTTFLINLALNITEQHPDKEAYFFSYEEDSDTVLINALNVYLDTPISNNNKSTLKNHFAGVNKTSIEGKDKFFKELIETKRLNINYSNYSSDTLIEAIRYLHKHAKPGAIFIDYIQLLNLPEGKYKTYSRQEEIKQICIALKDIAVETGLPIILGAQFNREVISQAQIHATKLGEAGDIERIANLIIGFWNNAFNDQPEQTIQATILKNRVGKVGLKEEFSFNGNTGKISNQSKHNNSNNIF